MEIKFTNRLQFKSVCLQVWIFNSALIQRKKNVCVHCFPFFPLLSISTRRPYLPQPSTCISTLSGLAQRHHLPRTSPPPYLQPSLLPLSWRRHWHNLCLSHLVRHHKQPPSPTSSPICKRHQPCLRSATSVQVLNLNFYFRFFCVEFDMFGLGLWSTQTNLDADFGVVIYCITYQLYINPKWKGEPDGLFWIFFMEFAMLTDFCWICFFKWSSWFSIEFMRIKV